MKLNNVIWMSIRRVEITFEDGETLTSFSTPIKPGLSRIFFESIAHVIYLENGEWYMIEEEVYEL